MPDMFALQKGEKQGNKGKKTPKSAPPAHIKRKTLQQEIDDDLSDDDFEVKLMVYENSKPFSCFQN